MESSKDEEETRMTTTAPPNETIKITSKFESWFQLSFCKLQKENSETCRKRNCLELWKV